MGPVMEYTDAFSFSVPPHAGSLERLGERFCYRVCDTVRASEIYGPYSYLPSVPVCGREDMAVSLTAGAGYQILVLLLLACYLLLILGYRREVVQTLKRVWRKNPHAENRDENERPEAGMQALGIGCGALAIGIAFIRLSELWMGAGPLSFINPSRGWIVAIGVAVLFLAVILVQKLMLYSIGSLTFNGEAVGVMNLNRLSFFISAIVMGTPAILLAALSSELWIQVMAIFFAAAISIHAVWYVVRSFLWFAERKISILLWILYLCAVEAMPLCIAVIGLMRSWPV